MIKTDDGLIHDVCNPEDDEHWGKTSCDIRFTVETNFLEAFAADGGSIDGITYVQLTEPPTTCFTCLTGGSQYEDSV